MANDNKCPIWGTEANLQATQRDGVLVDSPRAGGRYFVSRTAEAQLKSADNLVKARLTTWLVEQRRLGVECPEVISSILDDAERRRRLSVYERADKVLGQIQIRLQTIGDTAKIPPGVDENLLACSESLEMSEVKYLLDYLADANLIERAPSYGVSPGSEYKITPRGYAHLAEIEARSLDSKQAFIAMWFDATMHDAYEKGIAQGVWDAGYQPFRIDRKDHNNKIDDEIVAEIRRSRFVVADFTHGEAGMRGGVYYEAGFAHGLDIPVIFTCRQDVIGKIHFDTRQYNHIKWVPDNLTGLRKALSNRISATIGDGPLKQVAGS